MITYQEEDAESFKEEVEPFLGAYYDETIVDLGLAFDADFAAYIDANARGRMVCISARDDDKVVGIACFFLTPYLYSRNYILAIQDLLYILPEYRKGWTGIRLIKESEKLLKSRGVGMIDLVCRPHMDNTSLYERLGYKYAEKRFSKLV